MRKLIFALIATCYSLFAASQTLTHVCGFECGVISGALHVSTGGSTPTFSTSTVKNGSRSMQINPSAAQEYITINNPPTSSSITVIRAYVYFTTLPASNVRLISVTNSCGGIEGARYDVSDGKIYAAFASEGYTGSTGITVTTGQWYRLDVRVDNSATDHLIDVYVDGVDAGQCTAAGSGVCTNSGIRIGSDGTNNTSEMYYDDVVVSTTSGDFPLGAGYVNHFVPTSDNGHNVAGANDFERTLTGTDITNATTDAYLLIDDVPLESSVGDFINMIAPPNAGDYTQHIFGPAPGISTPTTAPKGVVVVLAIHQAGTGTGNMEVRLNDNGTTGVVYTATTVAGTTTLTYKESRTHIVDPPSAASTWTLSGNGNFNNLKVQFGSPAALDVNPDQYLDCIMIEAAFAEVELTVPGTPGDKRLSSTGVGQIAMNTRFKNHFNTSIK